MNKNFNQWVKRPRVNQPMVNQSPSSGQSTLNPVVNQPLHKRKKETTKEINPHLAMPSDDVNQLFKIFYETINPNINYAHKGNRDAAKWLIDKYGLEKVSNAAKYAISVQGKPYSPVITTPAQLKNKMSELIIFQKKSINQPKKGHLSL